VNNDLVSRVFYGPMLGTNTLKTDSIISDFSGEPVSHLNMVVSRNLKELDCSANCLDLMVQLALEGGLDERSMNQIYTSLDCLVPMLKDLQKRLKTKIRPSFLTEQNIDEDKEDDWS